MLKFVCGTQVLGVLVAVSLLQQADQWALPTLQASGLQVPAVSSPLPALLGVFEF
jgi:hypothetical protein